MKLSNKITIPLAAFTLIAAGAATTVALQSHAQSTTDSSITEAAQSGQQTGQKQNLLSTLVKAIAQKFNLNEADVQQVFDDQHQQMEQQRQQALSDRLAQAVKDGKLTQDQADKITVKVNELEAQRKANKTNFQNLTPQQRQEQMQAQRDTLQQWLQDNNIPAGYFPMAGPGMGHDMGLGMGQGHHGFGDFDGDGDGPDQGDQPSQAQ